MLHQTLRVASVALVSFMLAARHSAADPVSIGDPAPPISVETVLDPRPGFDVNDLSGKTIVIDFWATWCGPCIASFPHLNELIAELEGEDVVFLAISNESEEVVRRGLKKFDLDATVALDTDRSLFQAYDVRAIPRTIVIDPAGVVRASTHPTKLTAEHIRTAATGRTPEIEPLTDVQETIETALSDGGPTPLVRAMIRPSTGEQELVDVGAARFRMLGVAPRDILSFVYRSQLRDRTLRIDAPLPEVAHDMDVSIPREDPAALYELVRLTFESAFGVQAISMDEETDVYALRVVEGVMPRLERNDAGRSIQFQDGGLSGRSLSTDLIARMLGRQIGRPIIDETGLEGGYDFSVEWGQGGAEALGEAVRDQLGLELVATRAVAPLLVIREKRNDAAQGARTQTFTR